MGRADHLRPLAALRRRDPSSKTSQNGKADVGEVKGGVAWLPILVASCMECNSQKGEKAAGDFLRGLYRKRRLTSAELEDRLCAIDALASGKLRPQV